MQITKNIRIVLFYIYEICKKGGFLHLHNMYTEL